MIGSGQKRKHHACREAFHIPTLTDKLAAQKALKNLEARRNKLRRDLYDQQDAIDAQRNDLIAEIEKQLKRQHSLLPLFRLRWRII